MKLKIKKILKRKTDEERQEQPVGEQVQDKLSGFWQQLQKHKHMVRSRNITVTAILFVVLFVSGAFLFFHKGSKYVTVEKIERNDIKGTEYLEFGNYFLKYSPDGVSCVNSRSEVLWSTTFTMQTPIVDICETTAVVAEQQGTQVYVFDKDGLKGQFQTLLPIEKVRVAKQGVVAAILADEEVTWINFYEATGTLIAEERTTIGDFGYPVDLDLSPDGMKLAVSFARVKNGKMSTNISFYNFDSAGQTQMNNQVSQMTCDDELVPQIIFTGNDTAIAFRTDGFTVFSGRQAPKEKKTVQFEQEIRSIFYDDSRIGFVFEAEDGEHKFQMQVYNTSGKRIMQKYFDLDYDNISLQRDRIVMFNEQEFAIYKLNGQKRFQGKYRKPIENIMDVRGLGQYMVLTQDSADLIRLL